MNVNKDDQQLWNALFSADNNFHEARMALVKGAHDLAGAIRNALNTPSQRGAALRLLQILPEEKIREQLPLLVDLASVGHSDVDLVRLVILKINKGWLIKNIDSHVEKILRNGGEEEFRRIAELYTLLSRELLDKHLQRCAVHPNNDVKEIVSDFAQDSMQRVANK
jgi:hypothetical protein